MIRDIESEGTKLSQQERQLILNHCLGRENLSAIDRSTDELMARYEKQLNEHWLKKKIRKVGSKIATVVASAGASIGLRFVLKGAVIHGFPIAGTLTGLTVGGGLGALRGYFAEKGRQFGAGGIIAEYQELKNDSNNPSSKADALTFLHKALETKTFQGNNGDLLKILVFYQKEVGQTVSPNQIENVLDRLKDTDFNEQRDPYERLDQFRTAARKACLNSAWKGALRGAIFGGAIGLASDAVSWLIHHYKYDDAINNYLEKHWGHSNEMHTPYDTSADSFETDPGLNKLNAGQGIDLDPTAYGRTLSNAIRDGIAEGKLHLPKAYVRHMAEQGFSEPEAIERFLGSFNYAQPPHPGDWWWTGQRLNFNLDGLNELMNRIIRDGQVDYDLFAQTLRDGGKMLYYDFPEMANAHLLEQAGCDLMNRASEEAARAAAEPWWQTALQGAVAGAATGTKINRVADEIARSPIGDKNKEESAGGNLLREEETPASTERTETESTGKERPSRDDSESSRTREEESEEPGVNWEHEYANGVRSFLIKANETLSTSWESADDQRKKDIFNLFEFIDDAGRESYKYSFVIHAAGIGKGRITSIPTSENPVFNIRAGTEKVINLSENPSLELKIEPRKDTLNEDVLMASNFKKDDGYNYKNMSERLLTDQDGQEVIIRRLSREPLYNSVDLGAGALDTDNGEKILKVTGIDPSNKLIIVVTPEGKKRVIPQDKFEDISFTIKTWKPKKGPRRGGTHG